MACSTSAWRKRHTWPASTASPTWQFGRGSRGLNGTRSTSISTPTSRAGIRRLPPGRRWRGVTTFPSSSPASRCRPDRSSWQKGCPMHKQGQFSGVIAPVLTPFGEDGSPDAERFVDHCQWLMQEGCTALAPFGTTSGGNSLGVDERLELLEELVDSDGEAGRLMPGTGSCSLADAIVLTRHAVELGCGGVLMLPPFYYKAANAAGPCRLFFELIESVGDDRLKVYLYHIPPVAQVGFSLSLIGRLHKAF